MHCPNNFCQFIPFEKISKRATIFFFSAVDNDLKLAHRAVRAHEHVDGNGMSNQCNFFLMVQIKQSFLKHYFPL